MVSRKAVVHMKIGDPYGVRAKALLEAKGIVVSVQKIVSGESYITIGTWKGTYEELGSLDLKGKLEQLF